MTPLFPTQGNFGSIAIKYLDKLQNTPRATFTSDHYTFTYQVQDGFTFCVVADEDAGKSLPEASRGSADASCPAAATEPLGAKEPDLARIPLRQAALNKMKGEFLAKYAVKGQNAGDRALDRCAWRFPLWPLPLFASGDHPVLRSSSSRDFGPKIKEFLTYVMNNPNEFNKVATVQKKVDEVKAIMVENIDKVLERGERLELLVDKTDNLRFQADKFQKQGRSLRNKMWWQNIKMKLIVATLIIVVILIIFLVRAPPRPTPAAAVCDILCDAEGLCVELPPRVLD